MANNEFRFDQGYTGADKNFSSAGEAGGVGIAATSKKQIGDGEDFAGVNKGQMAIQTGNGSTGVSNTLSAASSMHAVNADGGRRFVRDAAQHESTGADSMKSEAGTVSTAADDLFSKINPS